MKAEEEEVDIGEVPNPPQTLQQHGWSGDNDEEGCWADEDPDNDLRGWKMKLVMEEDVDTS
jgi:COMPASS component SWD1